MNDSTDGLIQQLAGDLQPVTPLRLSRGKTLALAALAATVAVAGILLGHSVSPVSSMSVPIFILTNGLILLLALATGLAALNMALPRVGGSYAGPKWAFAAVALLPLAAVLSLIAGVSGFDQSLAHRHDLDCFALGSLFAAITAGVLVYWLRKGAPVSPETAGLFLGIAAGAAGSFANGLFCPIHSIWHLGIWHVLPVIFWGLIGRFAVPPLVRW